MRFVPSACNVRSIDILVSRMYCVQYIKYFKCSVADIMFLATSTVYLCFVNKFGHILLGDHTCVHCTSESTSYDEHFIYKNRLDKNKLVDEYHDIYYLFN